MATHFLPPRVLPTINYHVKCFHASTTNDQAKINIWGSPTSNSLSKVSLLCSVSTNCGTEFVTCSPLQDLVQQPLSVCLFLGSLPKYISLEMTGYITSVKSLPKALYVQALPSASDEVKYLFCHLHNPCQIPHSTNQVSPLTPYTKHRLWPIHVPPTSPNQL
jgi:hypothetical protein